MALITTNSFQLAVYLRGSKEANKLAIVTPGRLDSKDYASLTSLVDMLADEGYLAIGFDPPGTWESPGDISLYNTTNILKAINELIDYFDNRPTILLGHSRGGSNSMLAATTNQNVIAFVAIMSSAGPTNVELPAGGSKEPVVSFRDLPPGSQKTLKQKEFRLPDDYFIDQMKYDATDGLAMSKKPKLFFYGTNDVLVGEADVKSMFNNASKPKSLHVLKSEHDYRLHPEIIHEVNTTIQDFIRTV
jgi:pimeloyl-ACP methyl ester carboxylesterase